MSKFASHTGRQIIKALGTIDFVVIRKRGSHHFLRHPDGRCTVVPLHGKEAVGSGLLSKILRDVELTRDELENLF